MRFTGPRQEQRIELNITPLIDVVFLLLIFFMVSTTFERDSELQIELPEATAQPKEVKDHAIAVTIDASGQYQVEGRSLVNRQRETLKQAIARAREGRSGASSLLVSADASAPHQAVVNVMDAARQLGIDRLSFATRLAQEESTARTAR
ncbi:MAG: ExbD/TolR family protein [Gammaproteobacteria bacterium]